MLATATVVVTCYWYLKMVIFQTCIILPAMDIYILMSDVFLVFEPQVCVFVAIAWYHTDLCRDGQPCSWGSPGDLGPLWKAVSFLV